MALLTGGVGLVAGPALAHAHLQASTPTANANLANPPETLELTFTEPLEFRFSGILVQDSQGRSVALPAAQPAGSNSKTLQVALPALPAGSYTVIWRVTSIDTHRSEGRFVFTIRLP
jgi:methionine-rich copper-binding protein CopC